MPRRDIDVIDQLLQNCWAEVVRRCAETLLQSPRQGVRQLPYIAQSVADNIRILTRQYDPTLRVLLSNALHANVADYGLIERMTEQREQGQLRDVRNELQMTFQLGHHAPAAGSSNALSTVHHQRLLSHCLSDPHRIIHSHPRH